MLTKYVLTYGGESHELAPGELKNWDEVKCTYKRSDLGGVVRSFSSKFEFVGEAYDLLLALYLRDRFNAAAEVAVYTVNNSWGYDLQFSCPLDFSTVSIERGVFGVSCVDNSLAAIIKANKATKYDMAVGSDVAVAGKFLLDRLPMTETVTYQYTGGTSDDETGALTIRYGDVENDRVYIGVVNEETSVGGTMYYLDDQDTEAGSYMLEARKAADVEFDISVEYDASYNTWTAEAWEASDTHARNAMQSSLLIERADGTSEAVAYWTVGGHQLAYCGSYDSPDALLAAYPNDRMTGSQDTVYWALVAGTVWRVVYRGTAANTGWEYTGKTAADYFRVKVARSGSFSLGVGDKVWIRTSFGGSCMVLSSGFKFSWRAEGDACHVDAVTPRAAALALLRNMAGGALNVDVEISGHDARLASTLLLAAESIRGLDGARLATSFSEYCGWMEAVFGYTYKIGDKRPSAYQGVKPFGFVSYTPYSFVNSAYQGAVDENSIAYNAQYRMFLYYDGSTWYSQWTGYHHYNNPGINTARTDMVFKDSSGGLYHVDSGGNILPYEFAEDSVALDWQTVTFLHRSELFSAAAPVKELAYVRDVSYSVDSSLIYSSVTVGYDKQEYDSINGRDEFNFGSTYTTGCAATDRKLELRSKYRADSYGIEFAAQKRGADTTDSDSDSDVFFVLCARSGGYYVADRTAAVAGTLTDRVFNGAFSPMACARANAGYIGMMAERLTLHFASTEGNASASVGGEQMSADIELSEPLMTPGTLQLATNDDEPPADLGSLVRVEFDGIAYSGYISEIEMKFAKQEAFEYKLLVKTIET